MTYNIFLDDERFPSDKDPKQYKIVRNYDSFVQLINESGIPEFIRFDHDIQDFKNGEERTGYTCAKYLVEYMMDNNLTQKIIFDIHSQNFEGARNIRNLLNNFNRRNGHQGKQ